MKHNQNCERMEPGLGQEWPEGIRIRGTDSVGAGEQQHPSCSTRLRGREMLPPPSETTSSFLLSTLEGPLSGFWGQLSDGSCALCAVGCFTPRLSFAQRASGHLETQHKRVTARSVSENITAPKTRHHQGHIKALHTHPEPTWGCLWGHSTLPQAGSRPCPALAGSCAALPPLPPRGMAMARLSPLLRPRTDGSSPQR